MPAARQLLQRLLPSVFGSSADKSQHPGGYVPTDPFRMATNQRQEARTLKTVDVEASHEQDEDEVELMGRKVGPGASGWSAASVGTGT